MGDPKEALKYRVKRELQGVMRALLGGEAAYTQSRKQNLAAGGALLAKMKVGEQQAVDFTSGACWGYCKHKFERRVQQVCEAFGIGAARHTALQAALCTRANCVASIGGGPGNDLLGFVLFEKLGCCAAGSDVGGGAETGGVAGAAAPSEQAEQQQQQQQQQQQERLLVFDQASQWLPVVHKVAAIAGEAIGFGTCDVAAPLHGCAANAPLLELLQRLASASDHDAAHRQQLPMVLLLTYVLHETVPTANGDPLPAPATGSAAAADDAPPRFPWGVFLKQLWRAAPLGTIIFVKDQAWVEHECARLMLQLAAEGVGDCLVLDEGGVFLLKLLGRRAKAAVAGT